MSDDRNNPHIADKSEADRAHAEATARIPREVAERVVLPVVTRDDGERSTERMSRHASNPHGDARARALSFEAQDERAAENARLAAIAAATDSSDTDPQEH